MEAWWRKRACTRNWCRASSPRPTHRRLSDSSLGLQTRGGVGVFDDAVRRHVQRHAGAAAGVAVDRNFAVMQLHQFLADGKAEAAAAEAPADRGIGLTEG